MRDRPWCELARAGHVEVAKICAHERPRCWTGTNVSSDTLALCAPGARVSPGSRWGFHESSSWIGDHMVSPHNAGADAVLMRCYNHYLALAGRLRALGALHSQRLTILTGAELGRLGVPLCGG